jgi:hypothetical protein
VLAGVAWVQGAALLLLCWYVHGPLSGLLLFYRSPPA